MDWYKNCFYRVSLKALIRNEKDEILTVSEKGGNFSLPGGGWDYGEDVHECLRRELHEEIALTSDFSEKFICALPFYNTDKKAWQLWLAYKISYERLIFSIGEHGDETRWIALKDMNPKTQRGIIEVMKEFNKHV